jgi:hypothetical protein
MIQTVIAFGAPFGGLVALLALVAGVIALIWFARRWHQLPVPARWLGVALFSFIVTCTAWRMARDAALEWNPTISDDAQVIGTWADRAQSVTLHADHTFTCRIASQVARGRWKRDDWNLYLSGDSFGRTMRFVQFRGEYRLMTESPVEPDEWNGNLGLQRSQQR